MSGFALVPVNFETRQIGELRQWWDSAEAVAKQMGIGLIGVASEWGDGLEAELNSRGVMTRDADGNYCESYAWWIDADFQDEYPGGDVTCTEAYASLCRTGEALLVSRS